MLGPLCLFRGLVLGLSVFVVSNAFADDLTVAQICVKAREASGVDSDRNIWQATGKARLHGADQASEIVFDSQGRFRMAVSGVLPETDAFDGSTFWTSDFAHVPHPAVLEYRDSNNLVAWVFGGAWTEPGLALRKQLAASDADQWTIALTPPDQALKATLSLDASTALPKTLSYRTGSGDETWTFGDYKRFGARRLPTRMTHRAGTQEDRFEFETAHRIDKGAAGYALPAPDADAVMYDLGGSHSVEIKHIMGYLFVHPKVDGKDIGWFILDSGAERSCIDPKAAKSLGLASLGSDTTAGVVGVTQLAIDRGKSFQLGPLAIKDPVFLEFDLGQIGSIFGLPIGGICGYDFIAHAALDIEANSHWMQIFQPGAATLPPGAQWTALVFDGNTPTVECEFAGHRGMFHIDTGSGSTVDLFTPAVEKLHLMDGQKTRASRTAGAGGDAESRTGTISWFQIGGTKISKPTVGFQLTKVGVFASPYLAGNIGMGFLSKFHLIIDYQNERMAFIPTKNEKVSLLTHPTGAAR